MADEAKQTEPWKWRSRAKRGTVKQSHSSHRSLEDAEKLASPTFPQPSARVIFIKLQEHKRIKV